MKSKIIPLYMLTFSYAVFSFAVYIPSERMNMNDWLRVFLLGTAVGIFSIMLSFNKKSVSTWMEMTLIIYLIFLLSSKIYAVWRYAKLYHNRETADSIIIVTAIFILIFVVYTNVRIERFAPPLFIFSTMIIIIAILFNWDKMSRYNLYFCTENTEATAIYCVTMFDYIVPVVYLGKKLKCINRKNMILFFILINLSLILLTFFIFGCFRGNFVYSITPLQVVFQLSSTKTIQNFDGLFSFLLIFAYFAAILLIIWSLNQVNIKNKYGFLFLIPLFLVLSANISEIYLFIIEVVIILFLRIGVMRIEKS